ncbi:hypothetical protein [Prochlorothrix hollandica]|nr:hypothetical protein [Prochlorothrix hollandica]
MTPCLHYSIDSAPDGKNVILKIWEPFPTNRKPYLYQLNYRLASEAMARQVLNQHLSLLGGEEIRANQPLPIAGELSGSQDATVSMPIA